VCLVIGQRRFVTFGAAGARIRSLLLLLGVGLLGIHWLGTGLQIIRALTALLSRMGGSSVHDEPARGGFGVPC
jgi:hypothetical protein